jgi:protein-arginine kinase activator protein McsA
MICEACQKQEVVVNWHNFDCGTGREEHFRLCQACADARISPEVLQRIRDARARGEYGAVSGWTGYETKTEMRN